MVGSDGGDVDGGVTAGRTRDHGGPGVMPTLLTVT